MNPVFDLTRLGYFIRRQLQLNIASLWIALVAVVGTLLVISALFAYFNPDPDVLVGLRNLYLVVLFAAGYLFTSSVFNEMNNSKKSYTFMTLPVSTSEKLVGAWLIVAPVYLLVFSVCFILLTFFSAQLAQRPLEVMPLIFDKNVWICVKVFLITQTLFFLGACSFKGANFLKTLLALFVFVLIIALYGGLLGYMLFGNTGMSTTNTEPEFKDAFEYTFRNIIPFIFWYLLGPFVMVVAYFKLKERQV